jgi:hypothetical protein
MNDPDPCPRAATPQPSMEPVRASRGSAPGLSCGSPWGGREDATLPPWPNALIEDVGNTTRDRDDDGERSPELYNSFR